MGAISGDAMLIFQYILEKRRGGVSLEPDELIITSHPGCLSNYGETKSHYFFLLLRIKASTLLLLPPRALGWPLFLTPQTLFFAFVSRLQLTLYKTRIGGEIMYTSPSHYLRGTQQPCLQAGNMNLPGSSLPTHSRGGVLSANSLCLLVPVWRSGGGVIWCPQGHLVLVLGRLGQSNDDFPKAVCGIRNQVKHFCIWGCIV